MANIFRVYKDSQVTTDRIRAEAAADSIVIPERVVYVFGTADDVAPNFTTVAGALIYAASLAPTVTEPVVIRLFTKIDGTPYDLTGIDTWAEYANQWIYILSDFVRLNVETAEIPTILPAGQQVWYIDPNGVETLWVGNEDGIAWPAVGYKEYVALLTQTGTTAPVASVISNTVGTVTFSYDDVGFYFAHFPTGSNVKAMGDLKRYFIRGAGGGGFVQINNGITSIEIITSNESNENSNSVLDLDEFLFNVRIYP